MEKLPNILSYADITPVSKNKLMWQVKVPKDLPVPFLTSQIFFCRNEKIMFPKVNSFMETKPSKYLASFHKTIMLNMPSKNDWNMALYSK